MLCPNCDHDIKTEIVCCAHCGTPFTRVIKSGRPTIYCKKACRVSGRSVREQVAV